MLASMTLVKAIVFNRKYFSKGKKYVIFETAKNGKLPHGNCTDLSVTHCTYSGWPKMILALSPSYSQISSLAVLTTDQWSPVFSRGSSASIVFHA